VKESSARTVHALKHRRKAKDRSNRIGGASMTWAFMNSERGRHRRHEIAVETSRYWKMQDKN